MSHFQNKITYLSKPGVVIMGDDWFDVARPDHFWVRRRFEVFRQLIRKLGLNLSNLKIAEIGCGHGLVQHQFSKYYGINIDGFDLNEVALKKSIHGQNLFLYDIHEKKPEYRNFYDLIVLFDVIEHIDDQSKFIEAVLYHLKKDGILAINFPALELLYSDYDLAQGHFRRYNTNSIGFLERDFNCEKIAMTYWGMPLLPLLMLRKFVLSFTNTKKQAISSGFKPPSKLANYLLHKLSRVESIPQLISGTSLMVIYQHNLREK